MREIMKRIGYKARVLVVNDALVALEAGAPGRPGVVLIAGTGSIAYGRNAQNQSARAGGWGYMLGDEGSGYWIGRAALRAVLREADRARTRDAADRPAAALLRRGARAGPDRAGLPRHAAARGHRRRSRSACRGRSTTATPSRSASCAAPPTSSSPPRCRSPGAWSWSDRSFRSCCPGGIFRAVPWLKEELTRRLPLAAPRSRTILLNDEPAGGAVRLALAEARGGYTVAGLQDGLTRNRRLRMPKITVFNDERALARTLAAQIARRSPTASPISSSACRPGARRSGCITSSARCTRRGRRTSRGRRRSISTSSSGSRRSIRAATAPSCRSTCSRASTCPPSADQRAQRRRAGSGGRVRALRARDRGRRRHRPAAARHRHQRPHRLQRAGARTGGRARTASMLKASTRRSNAALFGGDEDERPARSAVDGDGDHPARAAGSC